MSLLSPETCSTRSANRKPQTPPAPPPAGWAQDQAGRSPKDEGKAVSRDRARNGFPPFGDAPAGWFVVPTTVQYKDAIAETFSRRVELPERPVGQGAGPACGGRGSA